MVVLSNREIRFWPLFLFLGYKFYHNVCVKDQTNFIALFFDVAYLYTAYFLWRFFLVCSSGQYATQREIDFYYYLPGNYPCYLLGVVADSGVRKLRTQLKEFKELHSEEISEYEKRLKEEEERRREMTRRLIEATKERIEREERQKMSSETSESTAEQTATPAQETPDDVVSGK